jgi:hypothetical protein
MRLPNKVTTFAESDLVKYPTVLKELECRDLSATELYTIVKPTIGSFNEYVSVIDTLYALGKLEYDARRRMLHYVA